MIRTLSHFQTFCKVIKNPYSMSNCLRWTSCISKMSWGEKLLMLSFSFRKSRLNGNSWHNLQANILPLWWKMHIPRPTHHTETSTDCINYRCYQSTTEKNNFCILRLPIIFDLFYQSKRFKLSKDNYLNIKLYFTGVFSLIRNSTRSSTSRKAERKY